MNDFDDFVEIKDNIDDLFLRVSMRFVRIFLRKINARYIQDAAVKFVKQPFLDILIAFRINDQIVYLDREYIKQKSLISQYDAVLANLFNKYDYTQIDELCLKLSKNIKNEYQKV